MTSTRKQLILSALLSLTGTLGCAAYAANPSAQRDLFVGERVTIGRDTVTVQWDWTVHDLLGQRFARYAFATSTPGRAPIVIVDGTPRLNGLNLLRSMRAIDVQHIDMLWPSEAGLLYGGLATDGAIVIKTRTANTNRQPLP